MGVSGSSRDGSTMRHYIILAEAAAADAGMPGQARRWDGMQSGVRAKEAKLPLAPAGAGAAAARRAVVQSFSCASGGSGSGGARAALSPSPSPFHACKRKWPHASEANLGARQQRIMMQAKEAAGRGHHWALGSPQPAALPSSRKSALVIAPRPAPSSRSASSTLYGPDRESAQSSIAKSSCLDNARRACQPAQPGVNEHANSKFDFQHPTRPFLDHHRSTPHPLRRHAAKRARQQSYAGLLAPHLFNASLFTRNPCRHAFLTYRNPVAAALSPSSSRLSRNEHANNCAIMAPSNHQKQPRALSAA
ncbi:uncharacterized protein MYCFIDRAFT_174000 [Pseudocercospora fijiensis CIRAD86]|uniref:Uncharacterized protein n=1 Tax=Pseudocercospora fijiensis (strain CIRAD86) TaxID=383855 RepID=M3A1V9_PSEFD|nr:uncharacterized protein MYCFIDRAFT_174000 [Pseudocercospora fijiensis CIRAD86]EME85154.1 hypothetical protein MYCFIDRAFT_174000 [Pseudocercospora fijiensis CIRAD86]